MVDLFTDSSTTLVFLLVSSFLAICCYKPKNTELQSLSHILLHISEENQLQSGKSLCNLNPM